MFTHTRSIKRGVPGELSKITEEYNELEDAYSTGSKTWSAIEASDLIDAVGRFAWKKCNTPMPVLLMLYLVRRVYKPIRNIVLDLLKKPKKEFIASEKMNSSVVQR